MSKDKHKFSVIILCVIVFLVFIASSAQAACTAITSLPYTINKSGPNNGAYCLTKNLTTSMTTGNAITITAIDNISFDLGGFEIKVTTPSSATRGISVINSNNVLIKNGSITGFNKGIFLEYGAGGSKGAVIEGITVTINENSGANADGIAVDTEGSIIRNCKITGSVNPPESTANGIMINKGSSTQVVNNDIYNIFGANGAIYSSRGKDVIENNKIEGVSVLPNSHAIYAEGNALISNNRIKNMDFGITCDRDCTYRDNLTIGATAPYPTNNPKAIDAGNNR